MSKHITTFLFIGLAIGAWGQSGSPFSGQILDASNTEMGSSARSALVPQWGGLPGTVSVQELAHPLEGKSLKILLQAQELIRSGDSARATEQLRQAMREPAAEPYALAMMGAELLKRGDVDSATPVLESAVRLLPGVAANHSNLAWAFTTRGRNEEALKEARRALQLDPGHARYRYVLGVVLLRLNQREEAEFHLRKASTEIVAAGILLEKYFRR